MLPRSVAPDAFATVLHGSMSPCTRQHCTMQPGRNAEHDRSAGAVRRPPTHFPRRCESPLVFQQLRAAQVEGTLLAQVVGKQVDALASMPGGGEGGSGGEAPRSHMCRHDPHAARGAWGAGLSVVLGRFSDARRGAPQDGAGPPLRSTCWGVTRELEEGRKETARRFRMGGRVHDVVAKGWRNRTQEALHAGRD